MKTVFINLSLRPDSKRRQLPVGLAYVMTAVKRAGLNFDLIDMDINHLSIQDLQEILEDKLYDIYAFGCIVTGFRLVRELAMLIKKINPRAIIIAGNSVATSIPEILLSNTDVDIAVMGEGDITVVELIKKLERKEEIRGVDGIVFTEDVRICHTQKRQIVKEIDGFGFPEWNIFDIEKYNEYGAINVNSFSTDKIISYPLNSARGCPFNCTFCYHVFKGERYRRCSEEAIIQEIKRLYYEYNCNFVSFWDELTFCGIKSIESMMEKMNKLKFHIRWDVVTRSDLFRRKHLGLVKTMKDLGCNSVSFSLENASCEILTAMNKRIKISDFIEQAKTLWEGGVTPLTSIIFGYPQETPQTIKDTLKVCEGCNIYPSAGFLLPLPQTPIYEWAKKEGYITDEVAYLEKIGDRQDLHINLTKMSDEELVLEVESGLRDLAEKQGLELESVLKTTTYQRPNKQD